MAGKGSAPGERRGGRTAGTPNKSSSLAREAIAAFVDNNADRLNGWLDEIAAENGAKDAFNAFTSLLEYHVPKLVRSEHTGKDGGDIKMGMAVRFVGSGDRDNVSG